jgi:hypothetical protein
MSKLVLKWRMKEISLDWKKDNLNFFFWSWKENKLLDPTPTFLWVGTFSPMLRFLWVKMLKPSLIMWLFKEELINYLKFEVVASETKYVRVHKLLNEVVGNMSALEDQVVVCKRHDNVIRDLIVKFQRGCDTRKNLVPQPFFPLKSPNLIPKTWIVLEKCVFCSLRFVPIWEVSLTSYKHAYHEWCALYFFGFPTKCVQQGCGEEMHDSWWTLVGQKK